MLLRVAGAKKELSNVIEFIDPISGIIKAYGLPKYY